MAKPEFRVMKQANVFLIQERDGPNSGWTTVGEYDDVNKAKKMVSELRTQGL